MENTASAPDRLMMTLFFAGILHALLILGVSFSPEPKTKQTRPLKVALILPEPEEIKPEKADFYAEVDSQGSGESEEAYVPTTTGNPVTEQQPQPTPEPPPVPEQPVVPEAKPEPEKKPVVETQKPKPVEKKTLVAEKSEKKVAAQPQTEEPPVQPEPEAESEKNQITAASLSQQIAQLGAELSQIKETRAKRPVVKYINSLNAHRYKAAAYERAWQEKVERIGNLNYPDEARRKQLSGSLILAVGIRKDGSIATMKIRHSSKHQVLDDAAKQIVRLAGPFAPFPDGLKDEADILVITRTWKFFSDARLATN